MASRRSRRVIMTMWGKSEAGRPVSPGGPGSIASGSRLLFGGFLLLGLLRVTVAADAADGADGENADQNSEDDLLHVADPFTRKLRYRKAWRRTAPGVLHGRVL